MEQWLLIFAGSSVLLLLTFLLFKYLLDAMFQKLQQRGGDDSSRPTRQYIPFRFSKTSEGRLRPDIQRFIHEEFDSPDHDVVTVVLSTAKSAVGISVFLQDRKVEYFSEDFPTCCVRDANYDPKVYKTRAGLAAVGLWGKTYTMAASVVLLIDDRSFVEMANVADSTVSLKLAHYEEEYDFKIECQWTDNYRCDHPIVGRAANEELWEGLIVAANRLLSAEEVDDNQDIWNEFPCEVWTRQRIRINGNHFHQLPHAGPVDEDSEDDEGKLLLNL